MAKRKVKKKRRVVKKRQVTAEPVQRRPLLGGGGSFSVIPPNPFQESVQNMMTSVQQNLNNNVNNQLNQMKTENQLLREKILEMQHNQDVALEQGRIENAKEMRDKINAQQLELDRRFNTMDRMEQQMMRAIDFGRRDFKQEMVPVARQTDEPERVKREIEVDDQGVQSASPFMSGLLARLKSLSDMPYFIRNPEFDTWFLSLDEAYVRAMLREEGDISKLVDRLGEEFMPPEEEDIPLPKEDIPLSGSAYGRKKRITRNVTADETVG